MARLPRLSVPGQLHLMIQRVLPGLPVFADPGDRQAYLSCLAEAAARHGVALHGYGLAPGDVRLLATPPDAKALGHMVQFVGRRFVAGFNRRHGRRGALWEGRFRATIIEPGPYFLPCLRYAEGAVDGVAAEPPADHVPWSSLAHHAGYQADALIDEHVQFWSLGNTPFEREAAYRSLVHQPMPPAQIEGIALATLHGWVLGSEGFVDSLKAQVDRRLRPLSPGRPSTRSRSSPTTLSDPN